LSQGIFHAWSSKKESGASFRSCSSFLFQFHLHQKPYQMHSQKGSNLLEWCMTLEQSGNLFEDDLRKKAAICSSGAWPSSESEVCSRVPILEDMRPF
jgi:hypothetical protein